MSLESLSDFLFSIEHSQELKIELMKCNTSTEIISMAKKYGYRITYDDLNDESKEYKVSQWFQKSKISPFRK